MWILVFFLFGGGGFPCGCQRFKARSQCETAISDRGEHWTGKVRTEGRPHQTLGIQRPSPRYDWTLRSNRRRVCNHRTSEGGSGSISRSKRYREETRMRLAVPFANYTNTIKYHHSRQISRETRLTYARRTGRYITNTVSDCLKSRTPESPTTPACGWHRVQANLPQVHTLRDEQRETHGRCIPEEGHVRSYVAWLS